MNQKTPQELLNARKKLYLHSFYKNIPQKDVYTFRTMEQKYSLDTAGDINFLNEDYEEDKTKLMLGLLMSDYRNAKYNEDKLMEFVQRQLKTEDSIVDMVEAGMLNLEF